MLLCAQRVVRTFPSALAALRLPSLILTSHSLTPRCDPVVMHSDLSKEGIKFLSPSDGTVFNQKMKDYGPAPQKSQGPKGRVEGILPASTDDMLEPHMKEGVSKQNADGGTDSARCDNIGVTSQAVASVNETSQKIAHNHGNFDRDCAKDFDKWFMLNDVSLEPRNVPTARHAPARLRTMPRPLSAVGSLSLLRAFSSLPDHSRRRPPPDHLPHGPGLPPSWPPSPGLPRPPSLRPPSLIESSCSPRAAGPMPNRAPPPLQVRLGVESVAVRLGSTGHPRPVEE